MQSKRKCGNCNYFEETKEQVIPCMRWEGEIQDVDIIKPEHEGTCTHEHNWRPSRGDMPCDMDYGCSYFEVKGD